MGKKKKDQLSAIGLYVSAGGFSAGIARHFRIDAHLTDGDFGRATLEHNFPKTPHHYPYADWPIERLAALEPDLMYCAPPCAPWSRSGGMGRKIDTDPRVEKVGHVLEAGLQIQPKIWVMESVCQMYERTPDFVQNLTDAWMEKGYSVTHFLTNYVLHGTPQNRDRYHFIAHKVELEFPDLSPTHVTVADVLSPDDPEPPEELVVKDGVSKRWEWILPYTPPGWRMRNAYRQLAGLPKGRERQTGRTRGGPPFMLARLRWDAPSLTLVSLPRRFHPKGHRYLTVREGMAVCGFNEYPEFEFVGKNPLDEFKQIAKGVLPPLGDYLGDLAARSLRNPVYLDEPVEEVIDFRMQAKAILRPIPRMGPFPAEHFGIMPHLAEGTIYEDEETDEEDEVE